MAESDGGGGDRDARWWMECQPHIRALRETMHSATVNRDVEDLLQKCVHLYMAAIHSNSSLEEEKIYIALSGGRLTAMESSFTWLGGWRPTSALLLVYSLMGVQLEDEIRNFGYGIRDLAHTSAVLSHRQLTNLANVQKTTRSEEKKLSKRLAHIQMLVSDQDVLAAVKRIQGGNQGDPETTFIDDPSGDQWLNPAASNGNVLSSWKARLGTVNAIRIARSSIHPIRLHDDARLVTMLPQMVSSSRDLQLSETQPLCCDNRYSPSVLQKFGEQLTESVMAMAICLFKTGIEILGFSMYIVMPHRSSISSVPLYWICFILKT